MNYGMAFQITLNTYDINDMNCLNEPVIILRSTQCSPGMGFISIDSENSILSFNNIDYEPSLELCNSSSQSNKNKNKNLNIFENDENDEINFENQFNINNQYYNIDECFEDGNGNERSSKFIVNENTQNPSILNGYCNQIKLFDCENYYIHSFKNNTCFRDTKLNSFTLMYCDKDTIYFQNCLDSSCSENTCILNKILPSNINKCPNFKNEIKNNILDLNNNISTINNNYSNTTQNINNSSISSKNNQTTEFNNTTTLSVSNLNNLNYTINNTTSNINNKKNNMTNNNKNTKKTAPVSTTDTNNNNKYFYPKHEQSITSDSNSNKNGYKKNNNSIISAISLSSTSSSLTITQSINLNLNLFLSIFIHVIVVTLFI